VIYETGRLVVTAFFVKPLPVAMGPKSYAPKLFGEPATGTPPLPPTRITASPRSLVPS